MGGFNTADTIYSDTNINYFLTNTDVIDIEGNGEMDALWVGSQQAIAFHFNSTILGLEENKEDKFRIYPNPTNGTLTITGRSEAVLEVIEMGSGKLIDSRILNTNTSKINIINSGVYLLRFTTTEGSINKKVIVL